MSITLSGKKYALNKVCALNNKVSNYVILLFSNNTSIVTSVLTDYRFMLPCMYFVHLALLDHSTPMGCARHALHVFSSSHKNCAMELSPHFDINCRITIFAFKLLANYEGNYECHDEITIVTIY